MTPKHDAREDMINLTRTLWWVGYVAVAALVFAVVLDVHDTTRWFVAYAYVTSGIFLGVVLIVGVIHRKYTRSVYDENDDP